MRLVLLIIFLIPSLGFADTSGFQWKNFETVSFQFGTWLENYAQVRATRDDDTNGFEITPFVSASVAYKLATQHEIIPELGYVIQQSSNEVNKNLFFIRADYAYQMKDWLKLRAGSSFMMLMQSGSGAEDTLNNGNTTDTYFVPNENRTSYNQTIDLGAEFIQKELSARVQLYTYAPLDAERRSYTISLSFNYTMDMEDLL